MPMMVLLPFVAFFGVFMAFTFNRAGESILGTIPAHLSLNIMLALRGAAFTSPYSGGRSRSRSEP
jgi:hypothetical protein